MCCKKAVLTIVGTSTPHRSETNGIAERAVRRVKEGTSAVLLQPVAICETFKISCLMAPCERRFGVPFNGSVIPFGAMLEYHQFLPKTCPDSTSSGKKMDLSEIHAKRLNAKEVLTPMSGENFLFPIAGGTVKFSGGDQLLRTST